MPLKILLADDSMTAQNMGKKILTEAGYQVIAVSNGAQAVKKIASEKPDIVVLDVYMPGYTGLEVCERVKGAMETAKTPVLLTVGKMEPFKAEEGNRVRADGVIVKPFEASDLVASVQKIAEQLAAAASAKADTTVKMEVPSFVQEFKDSSYEEWKSAAEEHPVEAAPTHPKIEVPHEMAGAAAFADMMGEESAPPASPARDTVAEQRSTVALDHATESAAAAPAAAAAAAPALGFEFPTPAPISAESFGADAFGSHPAGSFEEPPPPSPVEFVQPESVPTPPAAPAPDVEFTSAHHEGEVEPVAAPGFEPTIAQEKHDVGIPAVDPALVTDATELAKFTTKFGVENDEPIPVGIYTAPEETAAPPAEAAAEVTTAEPATVAADEFEARVAAAMSAYEGQVEPAAPPETVPAEEAAVEAPPPPEPVSAVNAPEPPPAVPSWVAEEATLHPDDHQVSLHEEMHKAFAAVAPEPELAPAPEPLMEEQAVVESIRPGPDTDAALAAEMAAAIGSKSPELPEPEPIAAAAAAGIGEAATAAARTGAVTLDSDTIANIVHRVVERLKPELTAEIHKEMQAEAERNK